MTEETQQTELEALKVQRAQAIEAVKVAEALEKQRTVLLPQLRRAKVALAAKVVPLNDRLSLIDNAIDDITTGVLTDYRLRKPRQKKVAQPEQEGEV